MNPAHLVHGTQATAHIEAHHQRLRGGEAAVAVEHFAQASTGQLPEHGVDAAHTKDVGVAPVGDGSKCWALSRHCHLQVMLNGATSIADRFTTRGTGLHHVVEWSETKSNLKPEANIFGLVHATRSFASNDGCTASTNNAVTPRKGKAREIALCLHEQ